MAEDDQEPGRDQPASSRGRRSFIKKAGVFGGLLGIGSLLKYRSQLFLINKAPYLAETPQPAWRGSTVASHRRLGRTGWKMSDISFGAARVRDPELVRQALDRGMTYIDTSPDYSDGDSERAVGGGIKGRRDKVFIASKFCSPDGHLDKDAPVAEIIKAVDDTLGRLGTDYVDLLHIHACNSIDRLMAPTFHEAFDRLKEQGKARFMGVSSHTPELEKVMNHAVDSDRFDVIMVAYNFEHWPDLTGIIEKAGRKDVGFVAMKTLKGAYHTVLSDFTPNERSSFTQAAFKWVGSNPGVSGLVVTIKDPAQLDEYLYASGKKLDPDDLALLERYDELASADYCRPGCGQCLSSCPHGVPVDDVLRYTMYYDSYGDERTAMRDYARLERAAGDARRRGLNKPSTAEACLGCPAPCQQACPYKLPIREKLVRAHGLLKTA